MNERYLFRGKLINSGKWMTGGLVQSDNPTLYTGGKIDENGNAMPSFVGIDITTVGQCTGLRDKNGTLIFEGDIVTWVDSDDDIRKDVVKWMRGGLCLCNVRYTVGTFQHCCIEIVGNIHDTPELLEGENATDRR